MSTIYAHSRPRSMASDLRLLGLVLSLLAALLLPERLPAAVQPTFWPQFRGPNASGVAADANPPVKIGPSTGVLWKIDVPWAPSSPALWKDRIYLTTFVDGKLQTRCYDRDHGQLLWTGGVKPDVVEGFHGTDGSPAASTPAVDAEHVVSYFGSFGLICYEHNGRELWRHPLPVARTIGYFGTGTSPVIVDGRLILNRDVRDGSSSLLALDVGTGAVLWETPRPTAFGSFGTPIHWANQGVDEIVVPGSLQLKGYDLKTGQERWVVNGLGPFACTTPVLGEGQLYFGSWAPGGQSNPWPAWKDFSTHYDKDGDGEIALTEIDEPARDYMRGLDVDDDHKITETDWNLLQTRGSRGENLLVAVKAGGHGDLSRSHVAWKLKKGLPYVPSPLYYQGRIYLVRDGGLISSVDAKTGRPYYAQERLPAQGKYYASPVAAAGRIYLASLRGQVTVIKAGGEKPEILHQANFEDRILATPALMGDHIYLRTQTKLYAFGGTPDPSEP
jgi:outer membrane protein assembly factor BamB